MTDPCNFRDQIDSPRELISVGWYKQCIKYARFGVPTLTTTKKEIKLTIYLSFQEYGYFLQVAHACGDNHPKK